MYSFSLSIKDYFISIIHLILGERHGQVVMASDSQSGWSLSARVRIPGREDHSCGQMQTSQQVWRPVVTPATQGGQFMTMILADDLGGYKDEAPSPFSLYWSAESVGPDIQPLRQSRALDVRNGKVEKK